MPVPEQIPKIQHTGNGVSTLFAFPFKVNRLENLRVKVGSVFKSAGYDYTASGIGSDSGSVTLAVAPGPGDLVVISRETPLLRERDYQQNGDLLADTLDLDIDDIWMALQELATNGIPGGTGGGSGGTGGASGGNAHWIDVTHTDYGAVGDGVVDDTAAINAAIASAMSLGGAVVYIPAGTYKISAPLIVDYSAVTTNPRRVVLRGDGPDTTRISGVAGDYTMLGILGSPLPNPTFRMFVQDLLISKGDALGTICTLDNLAYFEMRRCALGGGAKTVTATDVIASLFESCQMILSAGNGLSFVKGEWSVPNAINFVSCTIGENQGYGLLFDGPSCVNFFGGTIENNGLGAGSSMASSAWGIKLINSGNSGSTGLNMVGTYFENNGGISDIWLTNTADQASHSLTGVSFARISSSVYSRNNVLVESAGAGVVQTCVLSGCGHKSYNTYSPNSGRPYVATTQSGGGIARVTFVGQLFEDAVEVPTVASYWDGKQRFVSGVEPANIGSEATHVSIAQTEPAGGSGTRSPFAVDMSLPSGYGGNARGIWSRVTSAALTGAQTAVYGEAITSGAGGGVWGGVLEARDTTGNSSTNAVVGLQINHVAAGSVGVNARAGLSMVFDKHSSGLAQSVVGRGIEFSPFGNALSTAELVNGLVFNMNLSGAALKLQNNQNTKYIIEAENANDVRYLMRFKTTNAGMYVPQSAMQSTVLGGIKIIVDTFEYAIPFYGFTGGGQFISI